MMERDDVLEYKGYATQVQVDLRGGRLYGKILGIVDGVSYECASPAEVEDAFHEAVDKYLAFCEKAGRRPSQPYKGLFNVRIPADQHQALDEMAMERGVILNDVMREAVQEFLAAQENR